MNVDSACCQEISLVVEVDELIRHITQSAVYLLHDGIDIRPTSRGHDEGKSLSLKQPAMEWLNGHWATNSVSVVIGEEGVELEDQYEEPNREENSSEKGGNGVSKQNDDEVFPRQS